MFPERSLNARIAELVSFIRALSADRNPSPYPAVRSLTAYFSSPIDRSVLEDLIREVLPRGWACKVFEKAADPWENFAEGPLALSSRRADDDDAALRRCRCQAVVYRTALSPRGRGRKGEEAGSSEAADILEAEDSLFRASSANEAAREGGRKPRVLSALSRALGHLLIGGAAAACMLPLAASAEGGGDVLTAEELFAPRSDRAYSMEDGLDEPSGRRQRPRDGIYGFHDGVHPSDGPAENTAGVMGDGDGGREGETDAPAENRRRASGNFMGLAVPDSEPDSYGEDRERNAAPRRQRDRAHSVNSDQTHSGRPDTQPGSSQVPKRNQGSGVRAPVSEGDAHGMRAVPESEVPRDRIFRRPKVIFNNRGESAAEGGEAPKASPPEKFLFPSMGFLTQFDAWKFPVGDVTLLQDNYASLKRRHPDCRRIDAMTDDETGRIACSDTRRFQAEGAEVIFTCAPVNEVITGAAYSFTSKLRAEQFARNIEDMIRAAGIPSYDINPQGKSGEEARTSTDRQSRSVDTPMFLVTVQPSSGGWLVSADAYFQDRFEEAEVYAGEKITRIEFGSLTIGATKKIDMPELPKSCADVSREKGGDTQEFYGLCFGFPYEAHMQLGFNPATGILETAVLSPIGVSSGGIVDDMLRSRWGFPMYCRKTQSQTVLTEIKSSAKSGRSRTRRMKDRPSSLYAGTCEHPVIFSSDMRFIFENRNLNREDIMAAYEQRKASVQSAEEKLEAFDAKKEMVRGFFE